MVQGAHEIRVSHACKDLLVGLTTSKVVFSTRMQWISNLNFSSGTYKVTQNINLINTQKPISRKRKDIAALKTFYNTHNLLRWIRIVLNIYGVSIMKKLTIIHKTSKHTFFCDPDQTKFQDQSFQYIALIDYSAKIELHIVRRSDKMINIPIDRSSIKSTMGKLFLIINHQLFEKFIIIAVNKINHRSKIDYFWACIND